MFFVTGQIWHVVCGLIAASAGRILVEGKAVPAISGADLLGISRKTIWEKKKKWGL